MPLPKGPIKNRSCTDILCLLLFVFCIAGWVGVSYIGFKVDEKFYKTIATQICFRMGSQSCCFTRPTAPGRFVAKVETQKDRFSSSKISSSVQPWTPLLMVAPRHRFFLLISSFPIKPASPSTKYHPGLRKRMPATDDLPVRLRPCQRIWFPDRPDSWLSRLWPRVPAQPLRSNVDRWWMGKCDKC